MNKRIVFLVDNRKRDLPGLALVAHHLDRHGVEAILEPLEAWKACLAAYRPDMIVFNHLTGGHLVKYSRELKDRGVLVGALPNEGIYYSKDVLAFNASKFHNGAQIDHFFCWNKAHADALSEVLGEKCRTHVIGVPRFDLYFSPFARYSTSKAGRKTILICTNFALSKFWGKDPALADRHFAPWKDRIPSYRDYHGMIAVNQRAKEKFFAFLDRFVRETPHDVILRSHPLEDGTCYAEWHDALSRRVQVRISYDNSSLIADLITRCDVEIACETCTTTLESWITGKPTIELVLEKHPLFYHDWRAAMTTTVESPDELHPAVEKLLQDGEPEHLAQGRAEHLAEWCNSPDGQVSSRFADLLAEIVDGAPSPCWKGLSISYRRKSLKLKLLNCMGQAYGYDPLIPLKARFNPDRYRHKQAIYDKTIKPVDVVYWRKHMNSILGKSPHLPAAA